LEKSFIRTDMICEKKTSFEINKKLFDFDWIICSGENKYKLKMFKTLMSEFLPKFLISFAQNFETTDI
jgi:hypothetical protein